MAIIARKLFKQSDHESRKSQEATYSMMEMEMPQVL